MGAGRRRLPRLLRRRRRRRRRLLLLLLLPLGPVPGQACPFSTGLPAGRAPPSRPSPPPHLRRPPPGPMTPGDQAAHLIPERFTGTSGSRFHAHRQWQRPPNAPARARGRSWRGLQGPGSGQADAALAPRVRARRPQAQCPRPPWMFLPPSGLASPAPVRPNMAAARGRALASRARPAGHPDPALCPASRPRSPPRLPGRVGAEHYTSGPVAGAGGRAPPAPIPPAPPTSLHPGTPLCGAHGIPNEFRLMAVEHHVCQAALPPGPLPPPFAKEKRPSRVHPGSNMAAPMFLLLWLSWAELVRLQGAGSLAPLLLSGSP